jgi:predicted DNA binding CopG/RHH family protein
MNTDSYTQEELDVIDFIENKNPQSVLDLDNQIEQLKFATHYKISQKNEVNLRLLNTDLDYLKKESIKIGVSYQVLIGSILHQYVKGALVSK